jgi:murein DD-endopeptidase MepM/ murein hydrolase activator NlpD
MTNSPTVTVSSNSYVVQKGDTLSKVGQKTGIAWKKIADLNGIKFPYNIKVGQVLKLPKTTTKPTTTTTTSTTTKGYVYNGVNYSLVFNPTYYANSYSDLKRHFGNDTTKLFNHFCQNGMKEGRIASANFNVITYKNRYADLRKTFGDNLPAYYKHYVEHGYKEGRSGK